MGAIKIYNSRNFADSKRDDIPCVIIPWLYFVIFHDFFCFFILVAFFLLFLFLFFSIFIFSFTLVCFYLTWSWNLFFYFNIMNFSLIKRCRKACAKSVRQTYKLNKKSTDRIISGGSWNSRPELWKVAILKKFGEFPRISLWETFNNSDAATHPAILTQKIL